MCQYCQRAGPIPAALAVRQVLPVTVRSWATEQPLPPCKQCLQGSFHAAGQASQIHASPLLGQEGDEALQAETPP